MSLDLSAMRDELRVSLEQALEIEQSRLAETDERVRRCYDDARAFEAISAETRERIEELRDGITRLQSRTGGEHG